MFDVDFYSSGVGYKSVFSEDQESAENIENQRNPPVTTRWTIPSSWALMDPQNRSVFYYSAQKQYIKTSHRYSTHLAVLNILNSVDKAKFLSSSNLMFSA